MIKTTRKGKTYEDIYGVEKAKEIRKSLSKSMKSNPKIIGKNNSFYGKHHTKIVCKAISEAHKNKFGSESSHWVSREIRICKCGCKQTFECRINSNQKFIHGHHRKDKCHTKETIRKQRLAAIKRIEQNNGQCWPNYNLKACEFFKSYDEKYNTKGFYAIYGGGEYYIKELGYWPDYINFDKKIIIEYDENHHNKLKDKDVKRQQEIQDLYPDFKFIRIKENEY